MRRSTLVFAGVFLLAGLGLAVSVRQASRARRDGGRHPNGASQSQRVYTFTAWGGVKEATELRRRVIDPINASALHFQIRLAPVPSDYYTKLSTMIAGGIGPDFFYLSHEQLPAFAAQGALRDLTELIEADSDPVTDLSSYYPSILSGYRYLGRWYGLPWIAQPVILYCNAALFRTAGIPLPDASWDWDQFLAAAKALTRDVDGDGRIDQWGFILSGGWPPYEMFVWQNGAEVVDRQDRPDLRDPRALAAIDFRTGLIHSAGVAPPLSVVSEMGFSELFRAGKVAMFMGGAADDLDRIEGLEVVTAEVPKGPGGVRATFAWTAGLCIARDVPDPKHAFQAYKQLLDGIQHWKIPAPRRALAGKLEQSEPRKAGSAEVIRRSMEYMRTPPAFERQLEWSTLFSEEFEDPILRSGTPAKEQLRRVGQLLERAF